MRLGMHIIFEMHELERRIRHAVPNEMAKIGINISPAMLVSMQFLILHPEWDRYNYRGYAHRDCRFLWLFIDTEPEHSPYNNKRILAPSRPLIEELVELRRYSFEASRNDGGISRIECFWSRW
jgi:hypothetical protein